jgi:hypothetical protein
MNIKQWAAVRGDKLLATVSWAPNSGRSDSLYAATGPASGEIDTATSEALTQLLLHVRHALPFQSKLMIEHPADEMRDAFIAAGFNERRTLLWMRATPAT